MAEVLRAQVEKGVYASGDEGVTNNPAEGDGQQW